MATYSEAVNLNSFLKGIQRRISGLPINVVKKLTGIPAAFTDTEQLLSISFAKRMLSNLRIYLGYDDVPISYDYSALSLNTARDLLDTWLPTNIDYREEDPNNVTYGIYANVTYVIFFDSTSTSGQFNIRAVGGIGGGGGAIACDGDKNAKYYVKAGNGKDGESSVFYINDTSYTAPGGSGGSGASTTVGANPNIGANGNSGSTPTSKSWTLSIKDGDTFRGIPGSGGDGGAGVAISQGNSNSYNYSSSKNGVCSVGWTNEHYFAGGGGGGGGKGSSSHGSNNTYNYSGSTTSATTVTAASSERLVAAFYRGGRGGYCSNVSGSSSSGAGGQAYQQENSTHCATGGNGGGSGYILVTPTTLTTYFIKKKA